MLGRTSSHATFIYLHSTVFTRTDKVHGNCFNAELSVSVLFKYPGLNLYSGFPTNYLDLKQ